jgi:hypothetical protein
MLKAVDTNQEPNGLLSRAYQAFCRSFLHSLVAAEINTFSRYYDALYQLNPRPNDNGQLFELLDCATKSKINSIIELPQVKGTNREIIFLNGNFNHHYDIEGLLRDLKPKLTRNSRVAAIVYNSYLRILYVWANYLGIRSGELPTTFFTQKDLANIAKLAGFELTRARPVGYFPFRLFGLGSWINAIAQATPGLRWFGYAQVAILRPILASTDKPSLSILIPARNEKGNIENALKRLPNLGGANLELIFVEGHSSDGTWEEIQRVKKEYGNKIQIQCFQQTGKGKADAVRLGFSHAKCDLLTILDADLTMPPELLNRFYEAYVSGSADFVNGSRLVYPMEGEAMRFLNWLGNHFFASSLSFVLDARFGDSLCGTKLVSRADYARFVAWRKDFGDFDPFGDFELLFPAAALGIGSIDVPIRYRARTYGTTNIHRFRHGFILLKMTLIGLLRIRMGSSK